MLRLQNNFTCQYTIYYKKTIYSVLCYAKFSKSPYLLTQTAILTRISSKSPIKPGLEIHDRLIDSLSTVQIPAYPRNRTQSHRHGVVDSLGTRTITTLRSNRPSPVSARSCAVDAGEGVDYEGRLHRGDELSSAPPRVLPHSWAHHDGDIESQGNRQARQSRPIHGVTY